MNVYILDNFVPVMKLPKNEIIIQTHIHII